MSGDRTFIFGDFSYESASGLYRSGKRVPIPPKETELLELMLHRAGKVVSHREIEAILWPRQRVSYASIARCVHALRAILGGGRQDYIETVPKRGYRFVPAVSGNHHTSPATMLFGQPSRVPVANAHYLEGLREANRGQPDSQRRACDYFRQAAEADPSFVAPLLALSECRGIQFVRGYVPPWEGRKLGIDASRAALAIEPHCIRARATLIWFQCSVPGRAARGARDIASLTRKAPEHARLHFYHSWMLRSAGKPDAAVSAARRAVELDPHSLSNVHALNWALFMAGQVDEALESEREIAAREPWVDVSHTYVAVFASMLGLHEEAIQAGRKALEVSRGNPTFSSPLPFAMARAGETEEATRVIETLLSHKPERMVSTHGAAVFAAIGDLDRTAEWLEIARRELCPWFDSVQHDPRFAACLGDSRIREVIQDVADAEMLGVYADNSESTQRTAASG